MDNTDRIKQAQDESNERLHVLHNAREQDARILASIAAGGDFQLKDKQRLVALARIGLAAEHGDKIRKEQDRLVRVVGRLALGWGLP